jgi:hypothetical protein
MTSLDYVDQHNCQLSLVILIVALGEVPLGAAIGEASRESRDGTGTLIFALLGCHGGLSCHRVAAQ